MWNAWTAPPGALPSDYDPWSCEAHCARCGELAQDCHCDEEEEERLGERSLQDDLLGAMERLSKRADVSAEYRRDVPILIGALRLARDRALHGDENEKPWRFCPWCGTPTWMHTGDPTMNCGREKNEDTHDIDDRTR
jgi:hypothetical protein